MITDIERNIITVQGVEVEVVRKDIKNLHLGVYPPNGRVRVAVPLKVNDEAVRLAVVGKLAWINRRKAAFEEQLRQSKREMLTGESHYYLGQRYRLNVVHTTDKPIIAIKNSTALELHIAPTSTNEERAKVLNAWYRKQLKDLIPPIQQVWQDALGIEDVSISIRRMKTKWGSCNPDSRSIWVNLELAKKPVQCLEYIVLHELVHLIERTHTKRFLAIMEKQMPLWRFHRQVLNSAPLVHEEWSY